MKILAVDTALGACSVAVMNGARVLSHRFEIMERGHAEALAPMVDAAMKDARIEFFALDRLGVTTGPGTFTGQRVGLAFMRGLRIALERPLVGVTTLEAMAAAAMDELKTLNAVAIHDARRGEVYLQAITDEGRLLAAQLSSFDDAVERLSKTVPSGAKLALAGTAASRMGERLRAKDVDVTVSSIAQPDALWVARLAARAPESDAPPKPLYLRPPDAKLPAAAGGR